MLIPGRKRPEVSFPFGNMYVQWRTVSFREGKNWVATAPQESRASKRFWHFFECQITLRQLVTNAYGNLTKKEANSVPRAKKTKTFSSEA